MGYYTQEDGSMGSEVTGLQKPYITSIVRIFEYWCAVYIRQDGNAISHREFLCKPGV